MLLSSVIKIGTAVHVDAAHINGHEFKTIKQSHKKPLPNFKLRNNV